MQRSLPTVLLTVLLASACSSTAAPAGSGTVAELIAEERYSEAVEEAARRVQADPSDPQAVEDHRLASTAWYLERGRSAFYEGDFDTALARFEAAAEIAPEVSQVQAWLAKIHDEIADRMLGEAIHLHALDDLHGAAAAYEKVLANRPGDLRAQEGLARALLQINYRNGQGESYYNAGVRDLSEYLLWRARAKMGYATKYLGIDERVERRGHQVDGYLAQQRLARAQEFEQEGQYEAARNEYRLALLLKDDLPDARDGFERMEVETRAQELLKRAEILTLKGRYEEAEEAIEEGRKITKRQQDAFAAALDGVDHARLHDRYEKALDLEADYRYEEAVQVYDDLLEKATYYEDAIARRDTLVSFIELAAKLYEQAQSESDPAERLALYRQIETFWPEYRDIQDRIHELEGHDAGQP